MEQYVHKIAMMWSTASTSKDSNTNTVLPLVAGDSDTSGGGRAGVATSTFSSTTTSSAVNVLEVDPESTAAANDGDEIALCCRGVHAPDIQISNLLYSIKY